MSERSAACAADTTHRTATVETLAYRIPRITLLDPRCPVQTVRPTPEKYNAAMGLWVWATAERDAVL
jgi:hypothetical protein